MLVLQYFSLLYSVGTRQVRLHCIYNQETDECLSAGTYLTLLYLFSGSETGKVTLCLQPGEG